MELIGFRLTKFGNGKQVHKILDSDYLKMRRSFSSVMDQYFLKRYILSKMVMPFNLSDGFNSVNPSRWYHVRANIVKQKV